MVGVKPDPSRAENRIKANRPSIYKHWHCPVAVESLLHAKRRARTLTNNIPGSKISKGLQHFTQRQKCQFLPFYAIYGNVAGKEIILCRA